MAITPQDEVIAGTADSQHYLEISPDDTTYTKVPLILDVDMPEASRVTDDITPTDAHNTVKVAVDFFETNDINFEMVFNPVDPQHIAIKSAYRDNDPLYCRILFEDTRVEGYAFLGTLTKFSPDPDPKKKLRYKGTIVISGDIDDTVKATE